MTYAMLYHKAKKLGIPKIHQKLTNTLPLGACITLITKYFVCIRCICTNVYYSDGMDLAAVMPGPELDSVKLCFTKLAAMHSKFYSISATMLVNFFF